MIERTTVWWDVDLGAAVQVSVAILDNAWEPLCEITEPIGPFDTPEAVEAKAARIARSYVRLRGLQNQLFS